MSFRPFRVIEPLEARVLLSTLPSGFTETNVASLNTSVSAAMAFAPDGRLFVGDTTHGTIRVIKNGALLTTAALTLKVDHYRERGIDGIAFDPKFATAPVGQKYVYIYYTTADPLKPNTAPNAAKNRLSRFTINSTNADKLDLSSEKILLDNIDSTVGIHNGGTLAFGPDGMLYVGVGEAGVRSNAQSLSTVNGKILRIKPDGTIPTDNPFYNTAGARKEIWARGLRNPFSGAFKPGTSTLYVNDVGENTWEEIDDVQKGKNYGWPNAEGNSTNTAYTNPVYAYNHNGSSASIVGAAWYKGSQFPSSYVGKYFFGDYKLKTIWYLDPATKQRTTFASNTSNLTDIDVNPIDGSLWFLGVNGAVQKITYKSPQTTTTLRAAADAYVRDGGSAATNFGTATQLQVKKSTTGFNRYTYLRFSISSLSLAGIGSAKLRVWGKLDATGASNVPVEVDAVSDIAWGESTINWNNKPAVGTKQAAFNVIDATSRWYEIDLTSYVKAQKTAGKTAISLALRATVSVSPNIILNSDEATSNRPELKITAPASAPASAVFSAASVMESSFDRPSAWELLDA